MNKRCSCVVLKENVSVVHYNSGRGKTGRCALYFRTEGVSKTRKTCRRTKGNLLPLLRESPQVLGIARLSEVTTIQISH